MPGIVGLITDRPRQRAEQELAAMLATMRHESFYVTGAESNADLGCYVGWVARRGSFSDGMPVRNETRDISLIFSGEDFPDPGLKRRLKERGHSFSHSGSSYLVHNYEENPNFLSDLNGRFHGVLLDYRESAVTLFNDRYGMQRLYYYESPSAFYFAAEAKAILAVCPELRELDPQGVGEFVACGCVLENRSLFRGMRVLPPSSQWSFRDARSERKNTYFQPSSWEAQTQYDPETYYQQLKSTFARNLPRYFEGNEHIGASVTGGLDTRMILAWDRQTERSLPCYSFGGPYRDCEDVVLGRDVAKACGHGHEVIRVDGGFLSVFPRYAERTVYLTDGCTDVSHAPDLYVNERARQIAPVRMTGNYGGEVLRRVRAFKPVGFPSGLFQPEFDCRLQDAKATYESVVDCHPLSFAVFRQAPWHHYGLLALEQTQVTLRSPFLDNELVKAVFRAPGSATTSSDVSLRLIADGNPQLAAIRTDRGLGGNRGRLTAAALQRFLDFTVRAEYAYDYGMPQWASKLDRALTPLHLERLFLGRHKFYHFRAWYRGALSQYVREILLDAAALSRPYLQAKKVEEIVGRHVRGAGNYTLAIHKLLTLELVHRLFVDNSREPINMQAPLPAHSVTGRHERALTMGR